MKPVQQTDREKEQVQKELVEKENQFEGGKERELDRTQKRT